MKYIVELRADKTKMQVQLDLAVQDMEAKIAEVEVELTRSIEACRGEEAAHELHKTEWAQTEAILEKQLATTQKTLEAREASLSETSQALAEEQQRAAEDQMQAAADIRRLTDQREEMQAESAKVVAAYKRQIAGLEDSLQAERATVVRTKQFADDAQAAYDAEHQALNVMKAEYEDEVRRLNGKFLSARSEKKEVEAALIDAEAATAAANEVAAERESELLAAIEGLQQEVAKAQEEKVGAESRLEKEQLKRATAIVESQAERSLREATETSKVFDNVRVDFAYNKQERDDLDRVLDAATYRLMEVSYQNQEILGSTQRLTDSGAYY